MGKRQSLFQKFLTTIQNIFFPSEWEIVIVNNTIFLDSQLQLSNENFILLPHKFGCYYADPFIYKFNNFNYLVCEEFSYFKNKGLISLFKIISSDKKILFEKILLEDSKHLSFPFLFNIDNNYFLIPESSESLVISLFKFNDLQLDLTENIFENIDAVDTILFRKEDNIFLFTSLPGNYGTDLRGRIDVYVLKVNDFPSKKWKKVPILTLPLGRNAGNIISSNEKIYRLSQISDISYGKKIAVSEILYLEDDGFNEKFLYELNPRDFGGTHIHTINVYSDMSVFDRKRFSFLGIVRTQCGRFIVRFNKFKLFLSSIYS